LNALLGRVIAQFVALGFGKDAQECRIAGRRPAATDEHGKSGKQAIEEVEYANSSDADEVIQRPLDAKICEWLVQALVDAVNSPAISVCLHPRPTLSLA